MVPICSSYAADAVHRGLVTKVATECIAGIGWIRDQPSITYGRNDFRDQSGLRMGWVDFDRSRHARIVAG